MPLQLRFNDLDMLGHVNNGVYINLLDLAKATYFAAALGRELTPRDLNLAIVNINVNFFAPTYAGENIECHTAVVSISQHSLKMQQRILNIDTGEVKCQADTIMAGYDISTATSLEIDAERAAAIEQYEQRPLRTAPLNA